MRPIIACLISCSAALAQTPATYVTVPQLTLGTDSSGAAETIFNRLTDARRLSDGRIVVAVCGDRQLRSFDATGKYLATLKLNEGPSPQRILARLFPAGGDTLAAYEGLNARLSLVTPDLAIARTVPIPLVPAASNPARPMMMGVDVIGRFGDGTFLGRSAPPPPSSLEAGIHRRQLYFYRFDGSGKILDSLPAVPGSEIMVVPGQPIPSGAVRLGRTTSVALLPDRLVIGDQSGSDLSMYGVDLRQQGSVRTITKPVSVTDSMRAAWVTMANAKLNFPMNGVTPVYKDAYADALPAFRDIVAGSGGDVWVQDPGGVDWYPLIWTAYRGSRATARVELPPRFYPTQFGSDWVLGLAFDSTKTERVQLLRFNGGMVSDRHLTPREAAPANRPQCGAWASR